MLYLYVSPPSVGSIGPEAVDESRVDGALGRGLRGVPLAVVPHEGEREPVDVVAERVASHAVVLLVGIRHAPRSGVGGRLEGRQQGAAAELRRGRQQHAAEIVRAHLEPHDRTIERRGVVDVPGAGGGKVPLLGIVRTLRVLDARHQFRNQEVDVGVALAVRVRRHVHRSAGDGHGEVAAMIEIEPAQEILIGFSLSAVLGDDHAGDGLEDLALAHERPHLELFARDGALAGG